MNKYLRARLLFERFLFIVLISIIINGCGGGGGGANGDLKDSNKDLAELAVKVEDGSTWKDEVFSEPSEAQVSLYDIELEENLDNVISFTESDTSGKKYTSAYVPNFSRIFTGISGSAIIEGDIEKETTAGSYVKQKLSITFTDFNSKSASSLRIEGQLTYVVDIKDDIATVYFFGALMIKDGGEFYKFTYKNKRTFNATGGELEQEGEKLMAIAIKDDSGDTTSDDDAKIDVVVAFDYAINEDDSSLVKVDASDTSSLSDSIESYVWQWGDSSEDSSGSTAEHIYLFSGNYTIKLIVTNSAGEQFTEEKTVAIEIESEPDPVVLTPSFSMTPESDAANFEVDASLSTSDSSNLVSYFWDWGNGASTEGVKSAYTYTVPGEYIVTLTIIDDLGNTSSVSKNIKVITNFVIKNSGGVIIEAPSTVIIPFQVLNAETKKGISKLELINFEVVEGGKAIKTAESKLKVEKKAQIPFSLKTVLLIDISGSMTKKLKVVKDSAITFINSLTEDQELKIYTFSEELILLHDFSSNKADLIASVKTIERGFNTTRLFDSVIDSLSDWDNVVSAKEIKFGYMVIISDGGESSTEVTQALKDKLLAEKNKGDKTIYAIFIKGGDSVEGSEDLKFIAGENNIFRSDLKDLSKNMQSIQKEVDDLANSFYVYKYISPKRAGKNQTITLRIIGNQSVDGELASVFNSGTFFNLEGTYMHFDEVDFSSSDSFISQRNSLLDEITIKPGQSRKIRAFSYFADNSPDYEWSITGSLDIELIESEDDPGLITIKAGDNAALSETANLVLIDKNNRASNDPDDPNSPLYFYSTVQISVAMSDDVEVNTGIKFNKIYNGFFRMGSDISFGSYSNLAHDVSLSSSFEMSVTEVTRGQWITLVGSSSLTEMSSQSITMDGTNSVVVDTSSEFDNLPATGFSREMVDDFLFELNQLQDGYAYRLPTEAEWEYACRAGTTTAISGAGTMSTMGWYTDNSNGVLQDVQLKESNDWGLYDMHGNASEFCSDFNRAYPVDLKVAIDPVSLSASSGQRGGSFQDEEEDCRSSSRHPGAFASNSLGLRLVREKTTK